MSYPKYILTLVTALLLFSNMALEARAKQPVTAFPNNKYVASGNVVFDPLLKGNVESIGKSAQALSVCHLHTAYPHKSGHDPGNVNVVATVDCSKVVPRIEMKVILLRDRQVVATSTFANVHNKFLKGYAFTPCVSGTYQGEATATVRFPLDLLTPRNTLNAASQLIDIQCP